MGEREWLTEEERAEMREAAAGAACGEWRAIQSSSELGGVSIVLGDVFDSRPVPEFEPFIQVHLASVHTFMSPPAPRDLADLNARHILAAQPSRVLRLLDECNDLMAQNDVLSDLLGEITDLVRAAGYSEPMATFRAVQALIAERNSLAAEVKRLQALATQLDHDRARLGDMFARLHERNESTDDERVELGLRLDSERAARSRAEAERDDLRAQLSAKEAK